VARGAFTASEFAADLHLVHTGQATSPEYGDPVEFFTRTYLTEGLRDLLSRALRRVNGEAGASPVVNLQTNFGGGKTHSMLALYHLFSGTPAKDFPQELQELIAANGNPDLGALDVKTGGAGRHVPEGRLADHQGRRHRGSHALGRTWPGSWVAEKPTT
jgi:hypothetical protein